MTLPDVYCRVNRARGMEVRDMHACGWTCMRASGCAHVLHVAVLRCFPRPKSIVLMFWFSYLNNKYYVDYRYAVFFFNGACRGKVEITIS